MLKRFFRLDVLAYVTLGLIAVCSAYLYGLAHNVQAAFQARAAVISLYQSVIVPAVPSVAVLALVAGAGLCFLVALYKFAKPGKKSASRPAPPSAKPPAPKGK